MPHMTYLRHLRLRYGISMPELSRLIGVSPQQVSRLELRQVPCTPAQEAKLGRAVEAWLSRSRERLDAAELEYSRCKGKLLQYMEECEHEL